MLLRSFFIVVFLLGFLGVSPVLAQQNVQELLSKPMPEFEQMPLDEFRAQSKRVSDTPLGDPFLQYQIDLPKTWEKSRNQSASGFSLSQKILADLGRYFGPPRITARSKLNVRASEQEFDLTAKQWFVNYVLENGFSIQGVNAEDDDRVEGVYIIVDRDQSFVVRSVVLTNGKRVVVAEYMLPMDEWHNEKALQARVLESFKLLNKDDGLVEDLKISQFLDIAEMQYPVSWDFKASTVRSIDRMDAQLLNVSQRVKGREKTQVLHGKIDVNLISSFVVKDLEKEVEAFKLSLRETGLILNEIIDEPEDIEIDPGMEFAFTEIYDATDPSKPNVQYEFWFTIMAAKDYYYFTTLLTPSRNQDFSNWSRNSQAYGIVNRFLKAQENLGSNGR